jgi:hypothetical protein
MQLKKVLLLSLLITFLAGCGSNRSEEVGSNSAAEGTGAVSDLNESANAPNPEPATDVAEARVIKSGDFVSGEHPTSGKASILDNNGQFILELGETFETSSMGPDLVVVLHRLEDVIGSTNPPAYPLREGDYVVLAELESFDGAQRYSIPADVNLDEYQSAAIWCRRFNATFGAATLQ